jgi:hypothetical protein
VKTNSAPRAILNLVDSPSAPTSISPETVSQVGAGVLLLTVAVVELWLAFWAAGWWHRGGASLIAVVGAALVVRAVATIAVSARPELARRAPQQEFVSRRPAPVRVVLAEPAQR